MDIQEMSEDKKKDKNKRKPFSRFFIKDYINRHYMVNKNQPTAEPNKNTNPAAPDGGTGVPNGAPNVRTVVAVDSKGNPIQADNASNNPGVVSGEGPNQAIGEVRTQGTPQGGTAGDQAGQNETQIPQPQSGAGQTTTQPAPGSGQVVSPTGNEGVDGGGVDIDKLIESSTTEIKTGDEAQEARKKKQELLMRAINSRMYIENIIFKNQETDEQVGTKMRYVKDPYGKTVYDYMNDPEVSKHIGFKVSENDPKDGSPIEEQISIYWVDPVF